MKGPLESQVVFLARGSYRQRRYRDLARALPILGGILVALPLLWPRGGPQASGADAPVVEAAATSSALIYLFVVWIGLIVAAAALSRRIRDDSQPDPDAGGTGSGEKEPASW